MEVYSYDQVAKPMLGKFIKELILMQQRDPYLMIYAGTMA
jgi:hypothetical protein